MLELITAKHNVKRRYVITAKHVKRRYVIHKHLSNLQCHLMSQGMGQRLGPGPGRMACMVLRRTFHTAPEQEQGPEQGQGRMGYVPIFQVLKLFQVVCFNDISMAFRCPVLAPDTASVNGFCIISVLVSVPETASMNTPLEVLNITEPFQH